MSTLFALIDPQQRATTPSRPVGGLFRRLFTVALPGVIAIILISAVDLLAFNRLGTAADQAQQLSQASTDVTKLRNDLVELTVTLDALTQATARYNNTVYQLQRTSLLADHQAVAALDLTPLAGIDPAQQTQVLSSLRGLLRICNGWISSPRPTRPGAAPVDDECARHRRENPAAHRKPGEPARGRGPADPPGQQRLPGLEPARPDRVRPLDRAGLAGGGGLAGAEHRAAITRLQRQMARLAAGDLSLRPQRTAAWTSGMPWPSWSRIISAQSASCAR